MSKRKNSDKIEESIIDELLNESSDDVESKVIDEEVKEEE